ncbi:hypothetical protein [Pectobacterium parmentieri]|uniref:Uncharacterized protein n=1 Tax=Pectobacterium parmentieri TaxID=1905730 RepID=A0A8B3F3J7_PECPM|nr:hypothetical protein [Pectobacterium parmentieri]AOR59559.1 hypothetical protein A8F97_11680 [Pectobacterium parmentieri]AYH09470.1 hypothetical protein C5E24_07085 [Pectobacterium parmentieri]AYH19820.1 hypothetical protein C5E22_15715 [Pectobacterium parmentieri]AYH35784.1 hypothetical protein C5E17_06955 [Pectobacterium parmentieri]AZS55851.1 hypothetical protein C5E18_06790 [Pectobacterium parmentieri]
MIFNGDVFYRKTASIITTEQDGKGISHRYELSHLRLTSSKLTAISSYSAYKDNKIIKTLNLDSGERPNDLVELKKESNHCIKIEADSESFNRYVYTDNLDSLDLEDRFAVQLIKKIEINLYPSDEMGYFKEFSGYFRPMIYADSPTENPIILGFNFYIPEEDFTLLINKVDKGYNSAIVNLWIPGYSEMYSELPDIIVNPNSEVKRFSFISSLNIEKKNFTIESVEVIDDTPTEFDDEAEPTETDKKLNELTELSKKILTALTIIAACIVGFSLKTIF